MKHETDQIQKFVLVLFNGLNKIPQNPLRLDLIMRIIIDYANNYCVDNYTRHPATIFSPLLIKITLIRLLTGNSLRVHFHEITTSVAMIFKKSAVLHFQYYVSENLTISNRGFLQYSRLA